MRRIIYVFGLLALLLFPVHPAYANTLGGFQPSSLRDGRVVIGQDFTLKSGDALGGDLVVIGGAATIEEGARVMGDVVVIGGSLKLDGQATGDAVVIGGVTSMGKKASVGGDMVTMGGTLQRATGAVIGGNIVTNLAPPTIQLPTSPAAPTAPSAPTSVTPPRFEFNPFGPFVAAARVFFQALGLAVLAMLLTIFLHPQLDRVAQAVTRQPFISGSIGFLTVLLAPIALIILVVTLILIPVAFAAVVLLVLAWLFGIVAFGMEVGDRFTQAIHQNWEPVLSAGVGTFLLGIAVGTIGLIPCVGWMAPMIVGLMGLGAAVITLFGTRTVDRPVLSAPASEPTAGAGPVPPAS